MIMARIPATLPLLLVVLAPSVRAWSTASGRLRATPTCATAATRAPTALGVVMQQFDDDDDDFFGDNEVELVETSSGDILPCFMAASLEYEGATYAALYPVNAPVSLAEQVDERLVPFEDEGDAVLSAASAALAANEIELLRTPVVLTASGPGLDNYEGDAEALEYAEGDDEETEEALLLGEFEHDGKELLIVQMLDPLYVVGKQAKANEKQFTVPSEEEMEAVSDTIEQLVIEFEEGFDEDDDDDDFSDFDV